LAKRTFLPKEVFQKKIAQPPLIPKKLFPNKPWELTRKFPETSLPFCLPQGTTTGTKLIQKNKMVIPFQSPPPFAPSLNLGWNKEAFNQIKNKKPIK